MNDMPRARSLAIRTRSVGSGAVDGSSSRQARNGGHIRPCGDRRGGRKGGVQDVFGDRGHQRRRGRVRVLAAEQVDGAAGGDQRRRCRSPAGRARGRSGRGSSGWKNSAIACCTVVTVLPTVSAEPCSAPREQAVPEPRGVRVAAQDLDGLFGRDRVGDPLQHMLEACGRSARRRAGTLAAPSRSRRRRSGPRCRCGRRLTAPVTVPAANAFARRLSDHRVHAAGDRIPHQLRQPGGRAERVEHRDRPLTRTGCGRARRRSAVSSRSSTLVNVTSAAPRMRQQRRARAGPASCPSPARRTRRWSGRSGTHSGTPRGTWERPSRHPSWVRLRRFTGIPGQGCSAAPATS